MIAHRKLALTTGVLYLVTFVTSMPALALKLAYLEGDASVETLHWAVLLEILLALACIGTAVFFYPIGRRFSPALALGFVASRTLEATTVFTGAIAVLAVASIRETALVDDAGGLVVERALIAVHDWAFLLGPGLLPAVNALLFGTLLLRSRLVPRALPIIGLIGAPLLMLSALGTLFGLFDQVSPFAAISALPIAVWEFGIGIWLIVKGINPAALPKE